MLQFREIITNICENHHRDQHFNERMNQLLNYFKDQNKASLDRYRNISIFWKHQKRLFTFLLQNGAITISYEIYSEMINKVKKSEFFFFFFCSYEMKCQEGENDSCICSLIRQDSVEEFIEYVNRQNIHLSSDNFTINFWDESISDFQRECSVNLVRFKFINIC